MSSQPEAVNEEATAKNGQEENLKEALPASSEDGSQEDAAQAGKDHNNMVFVGGLAWATTEPGLKMYFEQYGEVKHIDFKRGFAFVHFASPDSVTACMQPGIEHNIDGRVVEVKVSEPHLAS